MLLWYVSKVKNLSISLFFASLAYIHLSYLRIDISGIYQANSFYFYGANVNALLAFRDEMSKYG